MGEPYTDNMQVLLLSWLPTTAATVTTLGLLILAARNFAPTLKSSDPNEWLIVIRDGCQRLAGVGLKAWVYPMETCVTFPSMLTKVSFEAMQTTKEMQGVKETGFAIFSVLRTEDGPFRYHKYVQGAGQQLAEDNLKGMAESLMRKHVATTPLNSVLRGREELREAVRKEMLETTKGWGVWLETLEIKDVQICSKTLFEDLQAEFRQDTHVRAEQVRLQSSKVLAEQRASHDEEMAVLNSKTALAQARAKTDERTTREKLEGDAELARARAAAERSAAQLEVERQKLETRRELETEQHKLQHELQSYTEQCQRDREAAAHAHQLTLRRNALAVDGEISERALQKYMIDSTAEVYKSLPLREIKLNNFVTPDNASGGGLGAMLPGLAGLGSAWAQVNKDD